MTRSPSSSGLLPLPGAPSSSWALYRARFASIFRNADTSVMVAFWLFGAAPSQALHPPNWHTLSTNSNSSQA